MSRVFILTLTLLWVLTSFGQGNNCPTFKTEEKCGKNEIGIDLYSLINLKLNNKASLNQSILNGIMFKRHCHKNAIRIGIDILHFKFSDGWGPSDSYPWYYKDYGTTVIGELRVGYERTLSLSKLRPFIASDLILLYGQTEGTTERLGDFPPYSYNDNYKIQKSQIGIAPAVGLKYKLTDGLSITTETNLSLVYFNNKALGNSNTDNGIEIYFNPLRLLSINYHFSK